MRSLLQFFRPHVVGRRIDEVAREGRRLRHLGDFGDVDTIRRHQADLGDVRFPVAAKTITAESEGERRKMRAIGSNIGETIDAGRQQAWQLAGPERIAEFGGLVLQAENDVRDLTVGAGNASQAPGFATNPLARANCREGSGRPAEMVSHVAFVANVIGMADAAAAVSNPEDML